MAKIMWDGEVLDFKFEQRSSVDELIVLEGVTTIFSRETSEFGEMVALDQIKD